MPHTITTTAYRFDELSDQAKDKARAANRNRDVDGCDWWDFTYSDAVTIGGLMGIEIENKRDPSINFSGFCNQGDGASYEGRYYYEKDAPAKVRAYASQDKELHRIVDELAALQVGMVLRGFRTQATYITRSSSNYSHSMTMQFQFDEYDGPNDDNSDAFTENQNEFTQLLRDFANWIYKQLEAEYNHLTSNEHIDEYLKDPDLSFDEDGHTL